MSISFLLWSLGESPRSSAQQPLGTQPASTRLRSTSLRLMDCLSSSRGWIGLLMLSSIAASPLPLLVLGKIHKGHLGFSACEGHLHYDHYHVYRSFTRRLAGAFDRGICNSHNDYVYLQRRKRMYGSSIQCKESIGQFMPASFA